MSAPQVEGSAFFGFVCMLVVDAADPRPKPADMIQNALNDVGLNELCEASRNASSDVVNDPRGFQLDRFVKLSLAF